MSSTTVAMSTSSSTSSSSSSTTDDTTMTDETTMSMPDSNSSGEPTTDTDTAASSSSSGGGEATYPACQTDMDPECPKPYTGCYNIVTTHSACTIECEDPDACPEPNGGTAVPACGGPMMDSCVLDCSGDATCPDGMECVAVDLGMTLLRCLWPTEA